jgi:hypothetical protein
MCCEKVYHHTHNRTEPLTTIHTKGWQRHLYSFTYQPMWMAHITTTIQLHYRQVETELNQETLSKNI